MTPKTSVSQRILRYLKSGGKLTFLSALSRFKCLSLAQRVSNLRAEGHRIKDKWITRNSKRYKQYSI